MIKAAFIIDRDVLFENGTCTSLPTEAGIILGQGLKAKRQLREDPTAGRPFRLYDDDGELYYEGRIITDEPGTELDFDPLDWAMGNAGCTRIDYRNTAGEWEVL